MIGIEISPDGSVTYNVLWLILFVILILLDAVLRALGLWKSAKRNQVIWFVCLLIFNTLGVLPLIYLLIFRNRATRKTKKRN